MTNDKIKSMAYLLTRLLLGVSMFGHGMVRLPKLTGFSNYIVDSFKDSVLPEILTLAFSYMIPFWEFSVGILLIIGLFTRQSLIASAILMIILIFGSTMVENWEAINSQILHGLLATGLLATITHNLYAVDNHWRK
ncbi:hypothetical protein LCGC14_0868330 [marine sediment metagenome]|uniref:DoxX family protein n=2 Tax=root TaxID=1 RepID=A0A831QU66_9FLAO|nr:DoxX family protein [Pricia sp.]HEA22687.1 DoxX family protein [Pricia antarctica]